MIKRTNNYSFHFYTSFKFCHDCLLVFCPHFSRFLGSVALTPWGTGARAPTFTNGWARGTMSRRTANIKLTKLYWQSRKRSAKRLIVLLETKKWRGTTKTIFQALPHFHAGPVPPTFKFVPAPLSEMIILHRSSICNSSICWVYTCIRRKMVATKTKPNTILSRYPRTEQREGGRRLAFNQGVYVLYRFQTISF